MTEDRWYGLLGPTAILNHAVRYRQTDLQSRDDESRWIGFHHNPATVEDVRSKIAELHWFLNFDDDAFGPIDSQWAIRDFVEQRFPDPCHYETSVPESFLGR